MRISDWSSDVCSSDLVDQQRTRRAVVTVHLVNERVAVIPAVVVDLAQPIVDPDVTGTDVVADGLRRGGRGKAEPQGEREGVESAVRGHGRCSFVWRSEEHTSELQSLMRISYAVFCLKTKKHV